VTTSLTPAQVTIDLISEFRAKIFVIGVLLLDLLTVIRADNGSVFNGEMKEYLRIWGGSQSKK